MIEVVYERISKYELTDWGVILQGVLGVPGLIGSLLALYVEKFANKELERIAEDSPAYDLIVSLACDSELPASELCAQLEKICTLRKSDMLRSRKVWRAVALEELLLNIDSDPVYGLIKLSEFWSSWEWPADAPLSMVSGMEALPEDAYHSSSNYEYVVDEHERWVKDQLSNLK
ncbi:DUF2247 family protein [Pseudomonas soli]|uniref:DUF2247 family protein n=1 Tax=Pseudomonas soli TaxID=1306993 RepID=UPI0028AFC620|nr:DUF2247 family protein [Pseudomonas soli]